MSGSNRLGVLPLSGNPVSFGHLHLIERSRQQCDRLIVLLANSDSKDNYLFTLPEREAMMRRATSHMPGVEVMSSDGLLVDFFLKEGCDVVFRGARGQADMAYEHALIEQHASIYPPIRTCFEFPKTDFAFAHISSTLIRTRVRHHLHVDHLAPLFVQQALQERVHDQYLLAVTGGIASGKSYVARKLVERFSNNFAHHINVDELIRRLYDEQTRGAQKIRETLAQLFGDDVLYDDRKRVDRTKLKERLFISTIPLEVVSTLQDITSPHIDRLYREALKGKRGLILLEWAQLAEMKMNRWTNNNVLVVQAEDIETNMCERGVDPSVREELSKQQWATNKKIDYLDEQVVEDGSGQVMTLLNTRDPNIFERKMDRLVNDVYALFGNFGI